MDVPVIPMPSQDGATLGVVTIDGRFFMFSLEDEIREPASRPSGDVAAWVKTWKVPRDTAIPSGRYRLVVEDSPRFGKDTLTVQDVPGFSFIRWHAGNRAVDTEGCTIVGGAIGRACVTRSAEALKRFKDVVAPHARAGNAWVEYVNPFEVKADGL